jgi:Uma2 family endonuclease
VAEGRDLRRLTEDEYLAFDRESETRWEYVDGEAFECMAGRTEHNAVVANVSRALGNALGARPCIVLGSQQKVATRATRGVHYPDVSVVCRPFERHGSGAVFVSAEGTPRSVFRRGFHPAPRPA